MPRYPLLFTDIRITDEFVLEFTKNDPDISRYYELVTNYLYMNPEDADDFIPYYEKMHQILPKHIVGFIAFLEWPKTEYLNDIGKQTTRDLHRWFYMFIKKILKRTNVWFTRTATCCIPTNPAELKIVEVDVNDRLSKIDTMEFYEIKNDVYYKFVDRESERE